MKKKLVLPTKTQDQKPRVAVLTEETMEKVQGGFSNVPKIIDSL